MLAEDLVEDDDNNNDNDASNNLRGFYNLHKKKRFNLVLPEAKGRRCWGSIHGWICTVGTDCQINLLNPLTRTQISLPPHNTFDPPPDTDVEDWHPTWYRDHFIQKMVPYKDNDNDHGFLVVALFGRTTSHLAFARPGDKAWTTVANSANIFLEFMVFNGQLFAVDQFGAVYICKLDGSESPKAVEFASAPKELDKNYIDNRLHLVNCFGDFLLVVRLIVPSAHTDSWETTWFAVYKLDLATKEWLNVEVLGDYAIFVGSNCSMSLLASEVASCGRDNIYFTDNHYEEWSSEYPGGEDMGVFNMEDETLSSHYTGDNVKAAFCAPLWIMPSLY